MRAWAALVMVTLVARAAAAEPDALAAKAEMFRAALHARHLSREGLVLYRIDLRSSEREQETGAYPENADGPTFTGLYAGGACARAESTHGAERAQAEADASLALAGIGLQMRITGIRGLLARTVRRQPPGAGAKGEWHAAQGEYAGWYWRGDVSMDQYANGLVPAIGLCRALFPERARVLAVDAATHLLANDFALTDPDGQRTRFGDLSWRSGFGFNSIAQLSSYAIFSLAAELEPGDPRWRETRDRLRDHYRVIARARTTNLRVFGSTGTSNDLMAFDLYRVLIPLARETDDPALADLRHGLWRSWLRVREDQNSYFDLIFCSLEPGACNAELLARAHAQLAAFPLDKRKRGPTEATANLSQQLLPGRKWKRLASEIVPIEARSVSSFEWKSSPYRLGGSTDLDTEYTGLDYLVAYWLYESVCATRGDCPRG